MPSKGGRVLLITMKPQKKYFFLFLLILSLLVTGFYRDFVFKNINALLQAWDADMDYTMPPSLTFFTNYEYHTLVNIKWVLTIVFSIIYLIISIFTVRLLFNNKKYIRLTVATYAGVLVVSCVFIAIGFVFHHSENMYSLARYLMGMVQSPVLLMIVIPAFKLNENSKVQ